MENNEKSFWKSSTKVVPGIPKQLKNTSSKNLPKEKPTSFKTYQESVSDAWDLGDDEFCIITGNRFLQ